MTEATSHIDKVTRIKLGPLFPRWLAAVMGILLVGMLVSLRDAFWWPLETGRIETIALVILILLIFIVPRTGTIEIDPAARSFVFKESMTLAFFHSWRGGKRAVLQPGSTITIGWWEDANALPTFGIKYRSGESKDQEVVLLKDESALRGSSALKLKAALNEIPGINVRLVRLDVERKEVPWEPESTPEIKGGLLISILLTSSGLIAGMFTSRPLFLVSIGVAALICQAVFLWYVRQKLPAGKEGSGFGWVFVYTLYRFVVMYGIYAVLGIAIRKGR